MAQNGDIALFICVGVLLGVVILAPLHAIFWHIRPQTLEELNELREKSTTQRGDLSRLREKDTTQQTEITNLNNQIDGLLQREADSDARYTQLQSSETRNLAEIADLKRKLENLRQEHTQQTSAQALLQTSLTQAQARAQTARTEVHTGEGEIQRLNRALTTMAEERDSLAHEARLGRTKTAELQTVRARLSQATTRRTELEGRIDQMLADHEVLTGRIEELERTNGEKQGRVNDLTARLTETQRRYDLVKQQCFELQSELASTR